MLVWLLQILNCFLKLLGFQQPPAKTGVDPSAQQRVVVLGGGVAGVATAFWLTAPEQNNRFKVTLYTPGWRLGGKCASGRNQAQHNRIEEHGLHLLMGCYQNAFTTIRACYQAWQRPASHPFQSWQDAFLPQRQITLTERDGQGGGLPWSVWNFPDFPRYPGEPGDAPGASLTPFAAVASGRTLPKSEVSVNDLIQRMVEQMKAVQVPPQATQSYRAALAALTESVTSPQLDLRFKALQQLKVANKDLEPLVSDHKRRAEIAPAAAFVAAGATSTGLRWVILANLGIAIAHGYLRDVFLQGAGAYDALNQQDFRDWLRDNLATDETLASAPVRAIYDLGFAFALGRADNIDCGSMAAGVTLRFALEVAFGYRDAPLWRMAAGTGDTVFTPLYQVLLARGASVRFFHRVTALRPTLDGSRLGEIELSRQASIVGGATYQPLIKVGRLDCWPSQPNWGQIQNGASLRAQQTDYESESCAESAGTLTLRAGTDFDLAVAALPPAVLQQVGGALVAAQPVWQTALTESRSVATRALQVWMRDDTAALGWSLGSAVLTSYAEPYDSWGDMSAVLSYETWPTTGGPRSLAYFCGCMVVPTTGPINGHTMLQLAVSQADHWLETSIAALWSAAPPAGGWWAAGGAAIGRYDKANFERSDLYVQTPAGGNVASRFSSRQPAGFANLYVVGDWTNTRFSGGCFESAVESAMLAANAIGDFPALSTIKTA